MSTAHEALFSVKEDLLPIAPSELERETASEERFLCYLAEVRDGEVVPTGCFLERFVLSPAYDELSGFSAAIRLLDGRLHHRSGCWETALVRFFRFSETVRVRLAGMTAEKYEEFIRGCDRRVLTLPTEK